MHHPAPIIRKTPTSLFNIYNPHIIHRYHIGKSKFITPALASAIQRTLPRQRHPKTVAINLHFETPAITPPLNRHYATIADNDAEDIASSPTDSPSPSPSPFPPDHQWYTPTPNSVDPIRELSLALKFNLYRPKARLHCCCGSAWFYECEIPDRDGKKDCYLWCADIAEVIIKIEDVADFEEIYEKLVEGRGDVSALKMNIM